MVNDKEKNKDKDKNRDKDKKEEPRIIKDIFNALFGAFREGAYDTTRAIGYMITASWKIATVGIIIAGSIAYLSGGCTHKYQTLDSKLNDSKAKQTIEYKIESNINYNSAKTLDNYLQNQNYK